MRIRVRRSMLAVVLALLAVAPSSGASNAGADAAGHGLVLRARAGSVRVGENAFKRTVLECEAQAVRGVALTTSISKCTLKIGNVTLRAPSVTFPGNLAVTAAAGPGDLLSGVICVTATARFGDGTSLTKSKCQ